MKILVVINDAPYGSEKAYNALRLVNQLNKGHVSVVIRIFLLADATACAVANQNTPNGYYNIERMLKIAISKGTEVKICGSCAEARGLKNLPFIEGTQISTMSELTNWTVDSDKVLVF